jgi:hypothetical protein
VNRISLLALLTLPLVAAACFGGGSKTAAPTITIQAARTYQLAGFGPAGAVGAGKPTQLMFTVQQPSGQPLTQYRHGAGPHTGVHIIIVRSDLATIIHNHPPVGAGGRIVDPITFPEPGRYRLVVDLYPANAVNGQINFQLFRWITVAGAAPAKPLPPFSPTVTVDGYRFTMQGSPRLAAIQPAFLTVTVKDPQGRPATFTPWFGALAHAIFFRQGSLDYFHTHVCSPGATGCTSVLGATRVAGTSSTPGRLRVGVLVPVSGTWRLFLQCKVNGKILTAPFTLTVR